MSLRGMSGFPANPRIRHQVARGALVLIGLTAPWPTMDGRAQDARTVWSGVYTTAQAERGQLVYAGQCSRCHGETLGGNRAYPLAGEPFMDHWDAHTLQQLFRRIRDTMPPSDAGTLSADDARDLVAYVLQQNGFPAGSAELAHDERELLAVTDHGKNRTGTIEDRCCGPCSGMPDAAPRARMGTDRRGRAGEDDARGLASARARRARNANHPPLESVPESSRPHRSYDAGDRVSRAGRGRRRRQRRVTGDAGPDLPTNLFDLDQAGAA